MVLAMCSLLLGLVARSNFRKKKLLEALATKDADIRTAEYAVRKRSEELATRNREVDRLAEELELADLRLSEAERQQTATLKSLEQRLLINKELTRLALMSGADEEAGKVITHFQQVAAGHETLQEGAWKQLAGVIETLHPGFNEAVQGRMGKQFREPLLNTVFLLKIGLKPAQIANVMNAKMQTVWNRVKRAEDICGDLLGM